MFKESYFWFLQPSSILNNYDLWFVYIFGGFFLAGIILWLGLRFIKHPIFKRAIKRWSNYFFIIGLIGLVWVGFRYENTPIFAKRFWAGLIIVAALVWLFFILKYTLFKFKNDLREFEGNQLKNKYMPKARK